MMPNEIYFNNYSNFININNNNNQNITFYDNDNLNWRILLHKIPFGILMSIISITSIIGNTLVIIVMIREKSLRTVRILYFFLCLEDLINH